MKKLFFILCLCFLHTGSARAQTIIVPPPLVPESVFPLGAFNISTLSGIKLDIPQQGTEFLRTLSLAGFNNLYHANTSWDFWTPNSTEVQQRLALASPAGFNSYLGAGAEFAEQFIGDFRSTLKGFEQSYFLTTFPENVGEFDFETRSQGDLGGQYSNNSLLGSGPAGAYLMDEGEWKITPAQSTGEDIFTVSDPGVSGASSGGIWLLTNLEGGSGGTHQAIVDFVYRLEGSEPVGNATVETLPNNPVLFTVEASVRNRTSSTTYTTISSVATKDIRWSDYAQPTFVPQENIRIKKFSGKDYATIRLVLEIPSTPASSPYVCFQLKSNKICNIRVRGFRLRTKLADEVLQGLHDQDLLNGLGGNGRGLRQATEKIKASGAIKRVAALASEGELNTQAYRVFSYIEDLCFRKTGVHIYNFISTSTGSYEKFRAIYEDQNHHAPPCIMEENFSMYDYLNAPQPSLPMDAVPAALRNPPAPLSYDDLGFPLQTGWAGYLRYVHDIQGDYQADVPTTITDNWPEPDHAGKYNVAANQYLKSATAALKYNGTPTRWYSLISTILTMNQQDKYRQEMTTSGMIAARAEVLSKLREGPGALSTYLSNGGGDYLNYTGGSKFSDLAQSGIKFDQRAPIATEIRADVWNAIAHGATGIYFNPFGSDFGGNIGIGTSSFCDFNANSGLFELYDGPTYNSNFAAEHRGLLTFTEPGFETLPDQSKHDLTCDDGYSFISDRASDDVHWDVKLIKSTSPGSLGTVCSRQMVPLSVTDVGAYLGSINSFPVMHNDGSVTNGALPGNWEPDLTTCSNKWNGWLTNWGDASMTAPTQDNVNRLGDVFAHLYQGDSYSGYPFLSLTIAPKIPTFYGYQEKWTGAKKAVSDLIPVAHALSKYQWLRSINLAEGDYRDVNGDFEQFFPIKEYVESGEDRTSQKVERFGYSMGYVPRSSSVNNLLDGPAYDNLSHAAQQYPQRASTTDEPFYELGLLSDPANPDAQVVVVANRRTWPVRFNGDHTTILQYDAGLELLGAIDVRKFNFRVHWENLNPGFSYYAVTNLRTNEEIEIPYGDEHVFSTILEPGEGTVFRIAPAYGTKIAQTSSLVYNNGHRVALLRANANQSPSIEQRVMVWERNGAIQYDIVNNPGEAGMANYQATPVGAPNTTGMPNATTLEGSNCENPSVAAKYGPNTSLDADTIAVIWASRFVDPLDNVAKLNIKLQLGWTNRTGAATTVTWLPMKILETELASSAQAPTPVVTPTRDGFFVAWASPNFGGSPKIKSAWVRWASELGNNAEIKFIQTNAPISYSLPPDKSALCAFPTVASRDEWEDSPFLDEETIHLAWQEQPSVASTNTHIFYAPFRRLFQGANHVTEAFLDPAIERVTKNQGVCINRHPSIAVSNAIYFFNGWEYIYAGEPIVVWESGCDGGTKWIVFRRERLWNSLWSDFTKFNQRSTGALLPMVRPLQMNYPMSLEFENIVYQVPEQNIFVSERKYATPTTSTFTAWQRGLSKDPALEPNLPMDYYRTYWFLRNPTLGYRSPFRDLTDQVTTPAPILYDLKMNRWSELDRIVTPQQTNLAHVFRASKLDACGKGLRLIVGKGDIGCATCPAPNIDSTSRREIRWLEKDITIGGDYFGDPRGRDTLHYMNSLDTSGWPIIEDTIRTAYFAYDTTETLTMNQALIVEDSSWLLANMPTGSAMSFKLILKDSASHQPLMTLSTIVVAKPLPTGPLQITMNMYESWSSILNNCFDTRLYAIAVWNPIAMALAPPPSGKGYVTLQIQKPSTLDLELTHSLSYAENFVDHFEDYGDTIPPGGSFKKNDGASPHISEIVVQVYPNPFNPTATVVVKAKKGMPVVVEVYNTLGTKLSTLFEGEASSSELNLKLDGSQLSSGNYFIRVVSGVDVVTRRVELKK